jgi:hypothetical protein
VGVNNAMLGGAPIQEGNCSVILRDFIKGKLDEHKDLFGVALP